MHGPPVVFKTDRIPRFGARCWLRFVRRSDLGWSPLPPSFLSSSPANNRPARAWPSRRKCRVGAARSRRRGHGPARLDGQAPRATVAGLAMKEGKDGLRACGQRGDEPTPRGERHCVRHARLAEGRQSAQRETNTVCSPIRRSPFGGTVGRQACATCWASADPCRQAQRAALTGRQGRREKGGSAPSGYSSPRSDIDRISPPATIR